MDNSLFPKQVWFIYLIFFLLVNKTRGNGVDQYDNEENKIYLNQAILCKQEARNKHRSTCWSTHGCFVSQVYELHKKKSTMVTYGCIPDTTLISHFKTCGFNYRKDRSTVFHYGKDRVRVISFCCGKTLCNKVMPTIPGENSIN